MDPPCDNRESQQVNYLDGFDKDQEVELRKKTYREYIGDKSNGFETEEIKWRSVFRILFPDVMETNIPSACKCIPNNHE
jgi:hypothetical protein